MIGRHGEAPAGPGSKLGFDPHLHQTSNKAEGGKLQKALDIPRKNRYTSLHI
jgi:hypothetical protein